ncbi:MAG: LysE family translocator [Erythrobacter sp.]
MDLIGFAFAVLLIELTPGPNMGWLIALTLAEGRRAGLAAMVGIAAGLACNAAIAVTAASLVLRGGDVLTKVVALAGAAMMAWLAWEAWRENGETSQGHVPGPSSDRNLAMGFVINLLNPKAALFFVTVMPQFVADARPSLAQGLALAGVSVTIATAVHLVLILGAARVRNGLMHERRARIVRRVLAALMLGVGVWFLLRAFA